MLYINILWQLDIRRIELIDQPYLICCLQLRYPLVHDLPWLLEPELLIRAIVVLPADLKVELALLVRLLDEVWDKFWRSEGLVDDDGLVPLITELVTPLLCSLGIVQWIGVKVKMGWLHELVHEVN